MKPSRILRTLITLGALSLLPATLNARTWTSSSDTSKTFNGDLKSYDSETKQVTIIHSNGRPVTLPLDKLSTDDQTFIQENAPKENNLASLQDQTVGKAIEKKLSQLQNGKVKKAELEFAPEYYLLYFSASW